MLLVAGCGGGNTRDGPLRVVASTNVYGDILRQIGGPHVSVTSVLNEPNTDPHLFEPGTATGLAIARASLVVQKGLGYDSFMNRIEDAAPSKRRRVLTVADIVGERGANANPHLWYDVRAMETVAGAIGRALAQADPAHRRAYAAGSRGFVASLRPVDRAIHTIRGKNASTPIAYTETVPEYLVAATGLVNVAPASFARAVEQGTEPSASALSEMTSHVEGPRVRALLYNEQAVSPITAQIRTAAMRAGIPVVPVTETLPRGLSYQAWMLRQLRDLARAVDR